MTQPYKDMLRQAETDLDAAKAKIERLKANLQKAHDGWQAEVKIIRDIADDNLTCAGRHAEAKITQLRVEIEQLRKDYTELLGSNEALTFKLVDAEAERDEALARVKSCWRCRA